MSDSFNKTIAIGSNYFEITNEIKIKFADANHKAKVTYDLLFKKKPEEEYDVEMNRLNYLVNGNEIINKFSSISNDYFQCLFPLQFKIVDNEFQLYNYKEIKKRIAKKDIFLINKYNGEGLDYIRKEFLKKVEDEIKMIAFVNSLNVINILNLTLKRYLKETNYPFNWTTPALGLTCWNLKMNGNRMDEINFLSEELNQKEFINSLRNYFVANKINNSINEDEIVENEFAVKICYESNKLNVLQTDAKCKIVLGNHFEYEEKIIIKSKI
ncbi:MULTISPECIES: hypothetical protein [Flavobacterium]|uniref:Uncharacterized protein n=1 Tax=Flavobacterium jumunjinense TaxID=998845 RepID=A0ABV5GPG0_9FLAO|nr:MULTISPECIES: hypothetical protein [Flavobacterium]